MKKRANQRRRSRKGRRSRSSVEDEESLALQSLEDINLDQGDQVHVCEELC